MSYKVVRILEGKGMRLPTQSAEEGLPRKRLDLRGRTLRAYSAYVELRDTAAWMHEELTSQLRNLSLTVLEFRVLNLLRGGPQYLEEMSKQLNLPKQSVAEALKRLWPEGWLRRWRRRLAPASARWDAESERGVRPRGSKRRGRMVTLIALTKDGKARFKEIHPIHVKLVKAYMRALDGREQLTLTRLCMKLRRENVIKFALEARWWQRDEDWAEIVGQR